MRLRCLSKFGKWIDYGKSQVKKFLSKRARSGSRDRFGGEATFFKFLKCIDYGECYTRGVATGLVYRVGHVTAV